MAARRTRPAGPSSEPLVPASELDPYLEELAADLEVDTRDLAAELGQQPTLLYRVGRELVRRRVVRAARRRALQTARERVDTHLRRAVRDRDGEMSEAEIAVQVSSHADVARAARAVDEAEHRAYAVRVVYEVFRQRARMLEALVLLQKRGD